MSEKNGSGSLRLKTGLAEMLKGGVIMDVTTAEQAEIAERRGAHDRGGEILALRDAKSGGGVAQRRIRLLREPALVAELEGGFDVPAMEHNQLPDPERQSPAEQRGQHGNAGQDRGGVGQEERRDEDDRFEIPGPRVRIDGGTVTDPTQPLGQASSLPSADSIRARGRRHLLRGSATAGDVCL